MSITKEDVVWYNDVKTVVYEEDGWRLTYHRDFFNEHEWFEIQMPDNYYVGEDYETIYDAIDGFNWWKEHYADESN